MFTLEMIPEKFRKCEYVYIPITTTDNPLYDIDAKYFNGTTSKKHIKFITEEIVGHYEGIAVNISNLLDRNDNEYFHGYLKNNAPDITEKHICADYKAFFHKLYYPHHYFKYIKDCNEVV